MEKCIDISDLGGICKIKVEEFQLCCFTYKKLLRIGMMWDGR